MQKLKKLKQKKKAVNKLYSSSVPCIVQSIFLLHPRFQIPDFKLLAFFCDCTNPFVLFLVRNPENGLSHGMTHHFVNLPILYTEIFRDAQIENFPKKFFDSFLIFAQNMDCRYTLEPPHPQRGGSNEYLQSMFWSEN